MFPCSLRSRSRVNLRVLRPLSRGPQGQPPPLRTSHGHPGDQGILQTSRGQLPHVWCTVPHSLATCFSIPRSCCIACRRPVSSALPGLALRIPRSRSPVPVHGLASAPVFPSSTVPVPHPVPISHLATCDPFVLSHLTLFLLGTVLGAAPFFSLTYPGIAALGIFLWRPFFLVRRPHPVFLPNRAARNPLTRP